LDAEGWDLVAQGFGQLRADASSHIADFSRATGKDECHVAANGVLHAEHERAGFGDVVLDVGRHEARDGAHSLLEAGRCAGGHGWRSGGGRVATRSYVCPWMFG